MQLPIIEKCQLAVCTLLHAIFSYCAVLVKIITSDKGVPLVNALILCNVCKYRHY